ERDSYVTMADMTDHEHLREAATNLRNPAAQAETEVDSLPRRHPAAAGVWTGPTATALYEATDDVPRRLGTATQELLEYAAALDGRADELEAQPDGRASST